MALNDCRPNQTNPHIITFEGTKVDFKPRKLPFMMYNLNPVDSLSMRFKSLTLEPPRNGAQSHTHSHALSVNLTLPPPDSSPRPKLIRGSYTTDLSIPKIHEAIRLLFSSKMASVPEMEREIESQKLALKSGWITHIESLKINEQICILHKEVEEISTGRLWNEYINECGSILIEYIPLASDKIKGIVTFSGGSRSDDFEEQDVSSGLIERRLALISDYINKASKYIKMDIVREVGTISKCPNCGIDFEEIIVDEDTGLHTCTCGYDRVYLSKASTYKDSSRVNIGGRTSYEDRITFIRAMDKFEGKKIMKIPDRLYDMLDEYFEAHRFPTGKEIRTWEVLPNGKKERTSVSLMTDALGGTKNAAYYDAIQVIASKYWGWVLPDLSSIREAILLDYDATQKVYEQIKERDSSLNVQIRMLYHYNAQGCTFELCDFKIVTSRDSLEYHHRMLKEMSRQTGIKKIDII